MNKIIFASDHTGVELKTKLIKYLPKIEGNFKAIDIGTNSADSVDYPDFGKKAASMIANNEALFAVIICGTGIGISIAANRNKLIRAALCFNAEMAEITRKHNDANILALGARIISEETAKSCLEKFLTTSFDGGRHLTRIKKLC